MGEVVDLNEHIREIVREEISKYLSKNILPIPIKQNKNLCRICGLDYDKITNYVCCHPDCPSGRVTCGS